MEVAGLLFTRYSYSPDIINDVDDTAIIVFGMTCRYSSIQ
ncbi:MAG: hypothetical protein PWR01_1323 [Clostridiales bacterium]|nr:hypothetical protein [Clostridiales bacterium]